MTTFIDESTAQVRAPAPAAFEHVPRLRTKARRPVGWRTAALLASALVVPAGAGVAYGRATTRRRGLLAGGLTALALGALRVELARWFTPEPSFSRDGKLGDLELRHYDARIEACVEIDDRSIEAAIEHGYGRLTCYTYGANTTGEHLSRTMPVLTAMRDGRYTVAFVMPPGRAIADLPRPVHLGVELREVPARRIAALRFHGRFTRDNIAANERALMQQLVDAGLSARGSITFAAFDSPATLPILRRNELWIELV